MVDSGVVRRLRVTGIIAVVTLAFVTTALCGLLVWRFATAPVRTTIVDASSLRRSQTMDVLYQAERLVARPGDSAALESAIAGLERQEQSFKDLGADQAGYAEFIATARAVAAHPHDAALRAQLDVLGAKVYAAFDRATQAYEKSGGAVRERVRDAEIGASAVTLVVLALLYLFIMRPSETYVLQAVRKLEERGTELQLSRERLAGREERIRALYLVASSPAAETGTQIDEALALSAQTLGLPLGFVAQFANGSATIRHRVGEADGISVGRQMPLAPEISARLLEIPRAIAVDDRTIGTSITVDGERFGILVFMATVPVNKPFEQQDFEFIDSMSTLIGSSLSRERRHAELQEMAFHDPLTGLANRAMLERYLEQSIGRARRTGERLAIHYIDLDRFKAVNDRYGHSAGDEVLREVARRLARAVRDHDIVARYGGDEFVVLQTEIRDERSIAGMERRLLETLHDPIALPTGERMDVGGSLGIAIYPADGETMPALLEEADAAMYRYKEAVRAREALM
jgi:diguanylate cyclase (GGDEF)-like protein